MTAAPRSSAVCKQWRVDTPLLDLVPNKRGDWAMASCGNGALLLAVIDDTGDDPLFLQAHDGVSLSIAQDADDHAFLSGGDDGKVFLVDPTVEAPTLLAEHKGKWIDHVAGGGEGHRAYASGKTLFRLDEEGNQQGEPHQLMSSIGGLSFSPHGKRLAVSAYGRVELYWTNAPETAPDILEWKGSHLLSAWSPDSKILLSAMQDASLHGWKLGPALKTPEPGQEMHMQGYETKIQSMGFSAGGKYLVTGGAAQVVCWPFFDGGPWEKQPLMLGGTETRLVTRIAPHPKDPVIAAGYDDGTIIMAPLDGRMEVMISPPVAERGAAVVGLCWNHDGQCLIAALENGSLLLFTLASVSRFVRGKFA